MTRARLTAVVTLSVLAAACSKAPPPVVVPPAPSLAPVVPPAVPTLENGPILPGRGTFVAVADDRMLQVWKKPDSSNPDILYESVNPIGQHIRFLVTDAMRDDAEQPWLHVLLPMRPNEAEGWVQASDVEIRKVGQRIVIDLSTRTLERFKGKDLLDSFTVGIGQPQYPTATGTFYVWAQVPQASPYGPYGVFALGLSGFSEVLKNWPGGGRMAIHGTADPSERGQMVSHGCIRVYNPEMRELKHVPLGTPVIIRQ